MLKRAFLLFLLTLPAWSAPAPPPETVAKVVEIRQADEKGTAKQLSYTREGKGPWSAYESMDSKIRDTYETNANTLAALEFAIGGRVGLNRDSKIVITSARSVSGKGTTKTIAISKGGMWVKCNKLKEPIEVQTNGGVMGIKGTEFVVDTKDDHTTQVSLLEGSIEVSDANHKPIGTMQPGDQWLLSARTAPVRKNYQPDKLREDLRDSQEWKTAETMIGMVSSYSGTPYAGAIGGFANAVVQKDPAKATQAFLHAVNQNGGGNVFTRAAEGIAGMFSGGDDDKPDFITNLAPDSTASKPPETPLVFRWEPMDGADYYALLVSPAEDMQVLEWSCSGKATQVAYPANARPLPKGRHYWRVVPLDGDNKALEGKKGSQTYFDLK